MTDRIDPGPGWRLLERDEIRRPSDESMVSMNCLGQKIWLNCKWSAGQTAGCEFVRRRITTRATKAIATRATVRAVFPDGATIADSIACESGLSVEMMQFEVDRWALSKIHLPESGAKYIMLEIQREGEP